MKLRIPITVSLKCRFCEYRFITHAKLLSNTKHLFCPKCGTKDVAFNFMTKDLRRRLYNWLRFLIERKYGEKFHNIYVEYAPEVENDDHTAW